MDPLKGWWTGKRFSNVGDSHLDCSWASMALSLQVFEQGGTVYDNSIEGVMNTDVTTVVRKFEDLGGRVVFRSPAWRGDTGSRLFMAWDHGLVGLWVNDGDLEGRAVSTDLKFFAQAQQILEEAIGPKASAGRVYVLISTDEGPKLQSIGVAASALERGNYNADTVADWDAVVRDLQSKDPSGRLAIFDGEPGTGKTYMIRGLLAAVPAALFVVVPAALIGELANPGMVNALLETRRNKGEAPTVFIVEDADDCLGARDSSNVNAVSALLNLGDGILGALMDIRLVCTTNLRNEELDEAVVRPGRLSRKIHVGLLDQDVAAALYLRLTGKTINFKRPMTLAQVYSMARDDGWKPVQKKKAMGFGRDPDRVSPMLAQELKSAGVDIVDQGTGPDGEQFSVFKRK